MHCCRPARDLPCPAAPATPPPERPPVISLPLPLSLFQISPPALSALLPPAHSASSRRRWSPLRKPSSALLLLLPLLSKTPTSDSLWLNVYGLYEVKVSGDGNCQFRALSDQMFKSPEYHKYVRKEIVK